MSMSYSVDNITYEELGHNVGNIPKILLWTYIHQIISSRISRVKSDGTCICSSHTLRVNVKHSTIVSKLLKFFVPDVGRSHVYNIESFLPRVDGLQALGMPLKSRM